MTKPCLECGNKMYKKKISSTFKVYGEKITVDNIKAYVCENCQAETYSSREAQKIGKKIKEKFLLLEKKGN